MKISQELSNKHHGVFSKHFTEWHINVPNYNRVESLPSSFSALKSLSCALR